MRIAMVCVPIVEQVNGQLRPAYMDSHKNNPHLGPYLLASVLRQEGFEVSVVDLVCRESIGEEVVRLFESYDVVSFSCNSTNWSTCRLLISWTRKTYPDKILVLGGMHATLFGEEVLARCPEVDFLIRGEGERALPALLRAIGDANRLPDVPGLVCRIGGKTVSNPQVRLLSSSELDELPTPLYSQMPKGEYKTLAIESSRGCMGACTFCAIPYQRSWRPLSAEGFVDRVEALQPYLSAVETNHFSVIDDCFTIDSSRVFDILKGVEKRNLEFRATYDARVRDFLDETLVSELAPYTGGVLIGAESFLPETLKKIRKPVTESDILKCAANVEKCGLAEKTFFSFIIGFPWETKAQVQENLKKISDLAVNYGVRVYLQWHFLTPGSLIWREFYQQGKVSVSDLDEIGFLLGEKWFNLSSSLSIEDRIEISDMVTCIQKVIALTRPPGSKKGDISFMIPPYLTKNRDLASDWVERYRQKMDNCL